MPRPLPLPLAVALERAIAALLRHDPDTRTRLERLLDGRVVRVRVTRPAIELTLIVVDGRVEVLGAFDGAADVTVSGSLSDLRSLRAGNDALYTGAVRIEGDVGVAQALKDVVAGVDVDVEAALEPLVGGTLARRAGLAGQGLLDWASRTRESLRADTEDYLKEESGLLAAPEEVNDWSDEVDALRGATDRLEARVARLEKRSAP